MKKSIFFIGIGLIVIGLSVVSGVPYFYYRSHMASSTLLKKADNQFTGTQKQAKVNVPASEKTDSLFGVIEIPELSLKAPILEGTQDKEIDEAVGHLTTSVLPGAVGTSILAAHNATWFRHIDRLKAGDEIAVKTNYGSYHFEVTRASIVHVGDPVYNTTNPSLVLESCYPLDALYLTPYRYLVYATLKSSSGVITKNVSSEGANYSAKIPSSIPAAETYLGNNSLPLGTLTYSGEPSNQFIQSNAPLSSSNALVSLYLAWLHASSSENRVALKQFGLQGADNPLFGHNLSSIHYQRLFNVNLNINGNQLIEATGTAIIRIHHVYSLTVKAKPTGNQLELESVALTRLN